MSEEDSYCCAICFEPMNDGEIGTLWQSEDKRSCRHMFHFNCAQQVLRSRPVQRNCVNHLAKCPCCRAPFTQAKPLPNVHENPEEWLRHIAAADATGPGGSEAQQWVSDEAILATLSARFALRVDEEFTDELKHRVASLPTAPGQAQNTVSFSGFLDATEGVLPLIRALLPAQPVEEGAAAHPLLTTRLSARERHMLIAAFRSYNLDVPAMLVPTETELELEESSYSSDAEAAKRALEESTQKVAALVSKIDWEQMVERQRTSISKKLWGAAEVREARAIAGTPLAEMQVNRPAGLTLREILQLLLPLQRRRSHETGRRLLSRGRSWWLESAGCLLLVRSPPVHPGSTPGPPPVHPGSTPGPPPVHPRSTPGPPPVTSINPPQRSLWKRAKSSLTGRR